MEFDWLKAGFLFVVYVAVDFLDGYCTKKLVQGRPFLSANSGTAVVFLLAFGVISYIENPWYILPIALGSWVGTFLCTKYG